LETRSDSDVSAGEEDIDDVKSLKKDGQKKMVVRELTKGDASKSYDFSLPGLLMENVFPKLPFGK
jgi:hypothetical protein